MPHDEQDTDYARFIRRNNVFVANFKWVFLLTGALAMVLGAGINGASGVFVGLIVAFFLSGWLVDREVDGIIARQDAKAARRAARLAAVASRARTLT